MSDSIEEIRKASAIREALRGRGAVMTTDLWEARCRVLLAALDEARQQRDALAEVLVPFAAMHCETDNQDLCMADILRARAALRRLRDAQV